MSNNNIVYNNSIIIAIIIVFYNMGAWPEKSSSKTFFIKIKLLIEF